MTNPRQLLPRPGPVLVLAFGILALPLLFAAGPSGTDPAVPLPGDELADGLALGVAEWLDKSVHAEQFHTNTPLFDQEWMFGTWMMAAVGFGQHAAAHPDARAADILRMEQCIDVLLGPDGTRFDRTRWRTSPLDDLDDPSRGHAAWLGYAGLALALHHQLIVEQPDGHATVDRYQGIHERVSDGLIARLSAPVIETYPGEAYPVDNAAGFGALGIDARDTSDPVRAERTRAALAPALARLMTAWRDPRTGVLYQMISSRGAARGHTEPRGSGTFLAAWFLGFADNTTAAIGPLALWPRPGRTLYDAGRNYLYEPLGPLGAMREYLYSGPANGDSDLTATGDIDSGPLILGRGVSATAFAIGAARSSGDAPTAAALLRTASLFGLPSTDDAGATHFTSAGIAMCGNNSCGALADAILFAMVTTPARR